MIYWPIIDTLLWGITSQWLVESSGVTTLVATMLTGLVLWNVIWRAQAEVARNLMDEIWNNNLVNLFSTPLTIFEWIRGVLMLSVVKTAITIALLLPMVIMLYRVDLLGMGVWLLVFMALVAMTGWWVGFLSAGIVLRYGPKVQTVVWTLPGFLLPFSAIYYPLDRLPLWMQPISRSIPTTYVFESMRSLLQQGVVPLSNIALSIGLNILYLTVCLWFFMKSFTYSKNLGLGRFD
jgi:ABC-2 type transport system permease protein